MRIWQIIKSVLLWSYERGTWQYDLLCILILLFIFLTPSSYFIHRDAVPLGSHRRHPAQIQEQRMPDPLTPRPEHLESAEPIPGEGVNKSKPASKSLAP
ncbi:MAG: hypothetical protein HY650_07345 [Acidobacteria bacterium]|nr:hypothetical protein [Acidobacteriota bacterium]